LKKQALLFLSTQVDTSDIEDIKLAFLYINENQNGRISLKEI
jgi:Ca2+-binding EF-hand superfamily protein